MLPAVSFWAEALRQHMAARAKDTIDFLMLVFVLFVKFVVVYYLCKRFIFVWGFSTS